MKPIKLKIRGLNSFIDTQEINFEDLTRKGLFGIFGPTGSGKSTILDGITLALYGEVARGSTNYMNTNCETLNVSYEFQISDKETKKYRVEREFRRDKRTGSVNSKSAKIIQVIEDNEIILEEQARNVKAKCEEILGLKLEDFTRTVVLPQGKFSEFLQLEGRNKREMLERLFNLQKYGDELSSRLAAKIKQEKEKANVLEGELKAYEDCSEEILQEKNQELASLTEKLNLSREELKKAEEDFNNGKQVWDLQAELQQQTLQKIELEQRELEITESEHKVNLGERSLRVKPYLDSYEHTLGQIAETDKKRCDLEKAVETLASNKQVAELELEEARKRKDEELPDLRLREQNVAEAIEEKKKLDQLLKEKNTLQESIKRNTKDLEAKGKEADQTIEKITNINSNIADKENNVEGLVVDEDYKKKINEAIVLLNNYVNKEKEVNGLSEEINTLNTTIQKAQAKSDEFAKEYRAKAEELQKKNFSLQELTAASPGDQDTLITLQEKLSQTKDQWNKYNEYFGVIQKSRETIDNLLLELAMAQPEKADCEQEIEKLEEDLRKIETENMAHILREALTDGEACPVCGSTDHLIAAKEGFDIGNIEKLKTALNAKKKAFEKLSERVITIQGNINNQESILKDYQEKVKELGEEFKAFSVDALQNEFDTLKADISLYNLHKRELDELIKGLSEEIKDLAIKQTTETTIKNENAGQLKTRQEKLNLAKVEFEAVTKELTDLKLELGVEDFMSKRDEINEKEKRKVDLERVIKKLREELKSAQDCKERLKAEAAKLSEDLKGSHATLVEKEKAIDEKTKIIKAKAGEVQDLEKYLRELSDLIRKIDQECAEAEKNKKDIEQQYYDCHTQLITIQKSLNDLIDRRTREKAALDKALSEEQIKDIDEAKSTLLDKAEIDRLRLQIKEYRDSLIKLTGTIENLIKKLDNRSLSEAQWREIQTMKEEKARLLKEFDEGKVRLEANIKAIKDKLVEKTKRLKIKAELDYKLSLLDDLEKLFKGKRFVEFVAANQLKYVSIEAGKKLKEITSGNYGLEVDENGKFLIRDYKNGGAQRDASTLSGGETFLASLSLALALSAQIQLKGTAPLELFFLDEGFGTLDDNLLEVVMDSLERIHNDKLSLGIISHVDSIKNRVPVKLIVTPAQAGTGGSKVKIEVS